MRNNFCGLVCGRISGGSDGDSNPTPLRPQNERKATTTSTTTTTTTTTGAAAAACAAPENINDRSTDSCTALLEHKSLVPASGRGTGSSGTVRWKKLGQSFRRVLSAGRMSASSTSLSSVAMTTAATLNCIQAASMDNLHNPANVIFFF